jgi:hypothetical protein
MDSDKIINLPRYHKKTFVTLLILFYVFLLAVAHKVFDQDLKGIFFDQTKYISSALITIFLGFFMILFFFPRKEKGEIIEIPAQEITKEFDKLLKNANRWRYQGNFGRYLRGKVLPSLASKSDVHVTACVIDPANQELCEKHAEYRSGINAIDKGKRYNAQAVSLEVVVTIVIAAWYARNRNIDIVIYLSGRFDPIRIDGNDDAIILTVEDRRSPALMITKKHFIAEHFNLQMQTARNQARKINLGGMSFGIELAQISATDVVNVLSVAKLENVCNELTAEVIVKACHESKNPYEN